MIFSAAGAAFRAFWAKIAGYRVLTTPEEQETRLLECGPCENLTEDEQCRLCGCHVLAKTAITTEKCPAGKWRAIFAKTSVKKGEK